MKFIDFFSGIGGFRTGMEMAGHECIGHCEIDKYADMSYRMMYTVTDEQREYLLTLPMHKRQIEIRKDKYLNGEWYAEDITKVKPEDLPEADCYCFGFPCQAFSLAGQKRGFEDTRGTLFFDVMRLAKERQPKVLLAENVKNLLSHNKGATFETILATLGEFGYICQWTVLNAKDFGVPQNRERVFIIGHHGTECFRPVLPIFGAGEQNRVQQIGKQMTRNRENPNQYRVYDVNGLAPSLTTMQGGGRQPHIIEPECDTNDGE